MIHYFGTKQVKAAPMSHKDYNIFRGWGEPTEDKEGYLIMYLDGGEPNLIGFDGYVSWTPKDVFDNAYQKNGDMTFGHAIVAMEAGHKVARSGWNGKGMFIVRMDPLYLPAFNTQGTNRKVNDRTAKWIGEDKPLDCQAYIAMFTADEKWQPGWLASQTDMLAKDWCIVE